MLRKKQVRGRKCPWQGYMDRPFELQGSTRALSTRKGPGAVGMHLGREVILMRAGILGFGPWSPR